MEEGNSVEKDFYVCAVGGNLQIPGDTMGKGWTHTVLVFAGKLDLHKIKYHWGSSSQICYKVQNESWELHITVCIMPVLEISA